MTTPPVPFPLSYWFVPGKLLAGYYPGAKDPKEAAAKITALLNAGIRHVINLMEPDEVDRTGQTFVPYEELVESLAAKRRVSITFDRLPIRDMSVPPKRFMWRILNQIDRFIGQGRPVYVHCLGGIGRTGSVVGCYLRRHGLADSKNVLEMIRKLRGYSENADRKSPETREQREMVVRQIVFFRRVHTCLYSSIERLLLVSCFRSPFSAIAGNRLRYFPVFFTIT